MLQDKLTKDRYKVMKAKEEAEDQSRRKIQNDNLIKQHQSKKSEQQAASQRIMAKKQKKNNQNSGNLNAAVSGVHLRDHKYKKQRSKSCMN